MILTRSGSRLPIARSTRCVVLLVAALGGAGCSYDFDAPFAASSAGWDAGKDGDASGAPDADADARTDTSLDGPNEADTADGSDDATGDADGEAGCPPGSKWCSTACVSTDSPSTGCGEPGCEPCAFDHGQALCVAGKCALGSCESTFGNCNSDPSDGCETNLTSTAEHCSSCGTACDYPHASATCVSSSCEFDGCKTGWSDCQNGLSDGCETDTSYDDQNCGYCGHVCPTGFHCNNGACRCSSTAQCDTGGGGVCNGYYLLCECTPYNYCEGPCTAQGACGG